jgi:hypothetical protein
MNELYEEFKGRGFTLLLVNMREDPDPDGAVTAAYRVTGTPTVYLVDRASQIVGRAIGRRDWASETGSRAPSMGS